MAIQALQLVVLAHLLSAADFGLMGMVTVITVFGQGFVDMGISNAIIQRQQINRLQLSSLYWLNMASGAAIFLIVLTLSPLITAFFKEPRLASLIPWAALVFLLVPIGQQFQILMQKDLRFRRLARIEVAAIALGASLAMITAYKGGGVFALIWGSLATAAARSCLLASWGWREWHPSFQFAWNEVKGFKRFGLYQMGERSINYFTSRMDQLIIGRLLGAGPLGYYSFAYNLVFQPVLIINGVINKVAFPIFSKVQDDIPRLQNAYLRIFKTLGMLIAPIMLGLAATAPLLIPLIFGPQWQPSVILIQLLAGVAWSRSISSPLASLMLARGRADWAFRLNLFYFFATPIALYFGAYRQSLGIASALLILQMLCWIPHYPLLLRPLIGPCWTLFQKAFLLPLVLTGLMVAGMWGILSLCMLSTVIANLILAGLTGIVIYFLAIWGFDRSQFAELRTGLQNW
jgi:O-antigen/teichoic acid export membrane protein